MICDTTVGVCVCVCDIYLDHHFTFKNTFEYISEPVLFFTFTWVHNYIGTFTITKVFFLTTNF